MSIFNSVLGSLSPPPGFRRSFEDLHAREHELPLYNSPPSPRIPPPVTASVLWTAPKASLSPPPRVPDDLLALQRRARHLEQQLQELLDAQADGLMGGLGAGDTIPDDLISNGSTTPTVSSVRSSDKSAENGTTRSKPRRKKVALNAARHGISRRIKQLASVKAEELDLLDEDLRKLQSIVEKTDVWSQKRTRLEKRIRDIESEDAGAKAQSLQTEASKLEQDIWQKEEELRALKRRHRRVLDELADTENSVEAKIASYKTSLSLLDREVSNFLAKPPNLDHVPISSSPYPTLPAKRRTLDMAREYWQDEYTRLAERCEEVDTDRGALDEGALLWTDVMKRVADYEASLQDYMQQAGRNNPPDSSKILEQMDNTIVYLEDKLEFASSRSWNLLVCAIGAELEAFTQGKNMLEEALGLTRKGKEKAVEPLLDQDGFRDGFQDGFQAEQPEEMTGSAIRITRSPPKQQTPPKQQYFDSEDDDPDPELMISHQDTDTD
ncbi:autophagy-related protein atg28 protein [Stemphylium lycopersici]|nr:autophagy-related protein atg28 protein [Stemphylium lycopersici]RAR07487.1 autophagy-related protein atg28 protein [Stemphylium lycopersici]